MNVKPTALQADTTAWKSLLPSSLGSLVLHVLVLLLAGWSLRGCQQGQPADAGGEQFRDIGLTAINDSSDAVSDRPADQPQDADVIQPASQRPPQDVVPQEAPTVAELLGKTDLQSTNSSTAAMLNEVPAVIGPGAPLAGLSGTQGGVPELIQPSGTSGRGASGSPTPGPGETSFMEIADSGQRFVYVIDISGSMSQEQRLRLAKAQLQASLRQLQPHQRFQVIFYDDGPPQLINLRNRPQKDWYPADTIHVDLACAAISSQEATAGTEHKPAILAALRLDPEVVYFLTDGTEPRLAPADLRDIRNANRSGARIHVVEFGIGSPETRDLTWLQQLAMQSGGKYRHWSGR
ncbi:MAG: VWA domain-containing protein [Planctomycetaceae bacterium]